MPLGVDKRIDSTGPQAGHRRPATGRHRGADDSARQTGESGQAELDRGRHKLLGRAVAVLRPKAAAGSGAVADHGVSVTPSRFGAPERFRHARVGTAKREALIVVVPTLGRPVDFPGLEGAVRSYCAHLPGHFADVRIDVVVEEACAASEEIAELARQLRRVHVVTIPNKHEAPGTTGFKARAQQFAHEVRVAEGEVRDDIRVLHMDEGAVIRAGGGCSVDSSLRPDLGVVVLKRGQGPAESSEVASAGLWPWRGSSLAALVTRN
jgi:hypothetical protein